MEITVWLFWLVGGYLLGSVPIGYLVVKWRRGVDILEYGSRNPGFSNILREFGLRLGIPILVVDMTKGFAFMFFLIHYHGIGWLVTLGFVMLGLGTSYSIFLRFRGGKGVAILAGGLLPLIGLPYIALVLVWSILLGWRKEMSLANLTVIPLLLAVVWLGRFSGLSWLEYQLPVQTLCTLGGVIVIIRHLSNIQSLFKGQERKMIWRW